MKIIKYMQMKKRRKMEIELELEEELEEIRSKEQYNRELERKYKYQTGRNFNDDVNKHMMSLTIEKPCRKDFMYDYEYERAVREYNECYLRERNIQERKQLRRVKSRSRTFHHDVDTRRALNDLGERARRRY